MTRMLGVSLLLHIALIAFLPGFGTLLSTQEAPFLEIETIFLSSGTEGDQETDPEGESMPGEFVVQPQLTVSEPERFERSETIDEWERIVLERKPLPPDIPNSREIPQKLPPVVPEAVTVQAESRQILSKPALERSDNFERSESVAADDATEPAEQRFDLTALRGEEEPSFEAIPEFKARELPEIAGNQVFLSPPTRVQVSRTAPASFPKSPARDFQRQVRPLDIPDPRLPERPQLPETVEERPEPRHEKPRAIRSVADLPPPDRMPEFQSRPLPDTGNVAILAVAPKRQTKELRPVITAESSVHKRAFRRKYLEKAPVPSLSRPSMSFSERSDSIAPSPENSPNRSKPRPEEMLPSPTPTPLFSVKRATILRTQTPSTARPLPRLFPETVTVERKTSTPVEPVPLSRMFGSRRVGLLPFELEALPQFEGEKDVMERDELLEKGTAEEPDGEAVEITIEGPAGKREVIYKPPQLPKVEIEMEVDIRLKFWVLPDGSVGEVIPLQRGDVRLERAAIQYLKSLRFTPVAGDRKIWGIAPIRYRLQ